MKIGDLADDRCPSHSGILEDICCGKKWVYTESNPTFAITYSYCVGGCGVFGQLPSQENAQGFFQEVFEDLKGEEIQEFEFSCENEQLMAQILELFQEKKIESEEELSYRYVSQVDRGMLETEFERYCILPIDRILLDKLNTYENYEFLQERFTNSWEKVKFFDNSLGFVAVDQNRIVGVILGSGAYKDYVAIDIEVESAYRRRGIAENLTKCFITECQTKHYIAQWDCVESNVPSNHLAQKMGFELFKKRLYYWFDIA